MPSLRSWPGLCLLPSLAAAVACAPDASPGAKSRGRSVDVGPVDVGPVADAAVPPSPPAPPVQGAPGFCARAGADVVRDVFCSDPYSVHGLGDLLAALGLAFDYPDAGTYSGTIGLYASPAGSTAVLLGHSTSLSADLVSSINPRALVLGAKAITAFTRGVQQVEIIAGDRLSSGLNFYLLSFQQACNASQAGCTHGDLFTPRIESSWTSVTVRDAEDLKNTPSDCRQCHQRGREKPILLMRELDGPWTHFFGPDVKGPDDFPEPTGIDLLHDYIAAKGDESYGGIPGFVLRQTSGITLENLVGFSQPLVFDGSAILNERWPYGPSGYASTPERSATWDAAFAAFTRGEQLALPFYAPRATDPGKLSRATTAYRGFLDGTVGVDDLPDLGDVFPDDPATRTEIGFQTTPGAKPAEALVQACGPCHNDVLDQTISRARFNVALGRLSSEELNTAIERIQLPREAPGAMPPLGRRQLDRDAVSALVNYLKSGVRTADEDAFLDHAAQVGMAP